MRKLLLLIVSLSIGVSAKADQTNSVSRVPLHVDSATGEVYGGALQPYELERLNTPTLKAARKAAAFSLEHPEEFLKTVSKSAAQVAFEKREMDAILFPQIVQINTSDTNRLARIQQLLAEISTPKTR